MSIEIECPGCGQCYASPERHAGKEIHCPACGCAIQVPAIESRLEPPPTDESETIEIECLGCEARYASPVRHAGKQIDCPACGGPIDVPALVAETVAASPGGNSFALSSQMDDWLDAELAAGLAPRAATNPLLATAAVAPTGTFLPTPPRKVERATVSLSLPRIQLSSQVKTLLAGVVVLVAGGIILAANPELLREIVPLMKPVGFIMISAGWLWCFGVAVNDDDPMSAKYWLILPVYDIYYIISRFDECHKPALLMAVGIVLTVASVFLSGDPGAM